MSKYFLPPKNTDSHLADFDSLQFLLSAYLTSLLPSSSIDYPLVFCVLYNCWCWNVTQTVQSCLRWTNHLQTKHSSEIWGHNRPVVSVLLSCRGYVIWWHSMLTDTLFSELKKNIIVCDIKANKMCFSGPWHWKQWHR